ncbi:MAG: hypothetical protein HN712_00035 [Gemmatimonadetes bacterium]|jgi:hypothetical protein|nr:hypothetical protein [Gemmatimonadota bacterium]MBT6148269.1 hypothetical protein [Gemmatimonadota bacterium]MBT7858655.1 hypothetical protein [Gemmatimonadota bacterium]
MQRILTPFCALALLLTACGQSTPEQETDQQATEAAATDFGSAADVQAYLQNIGPHVQRISELQALYETALATGADDSVDRRGTGRNLATKAADAKPQLQELLVTFDTIEPPPLLAPFHRDVRKLINLRLDAYGKTIKGWDAELAGGEHEAIYGEVEKTLAEANQLIQALNEQMVQITTSLASAASATSP